MVRRGRHDGHDHLDPLGDPGDVERADAELAVRLRGLLDSGDGYAGAAKPVIDWDNESAREALIDSRARDGHALLAALDGDKDLPEPVVAAARLLATVLGQDLDAGADGVFRIAGKVAADRVISTVNPEARHGHKTNHRGSTATRATSPWTGQ